MDFFSQRCHAIYKKIALCNIKACSATQVTRKLHCVTLKPGLHTVVTMAEHASDDAPKRNLRLPTHRLQIFFVKYEYLQSLQPCEDQGTREKLKKRVFNHVLAILTTYMETRI